MKKLFLLLAAIVTFALSASAQNRTYTGTVLSATDDEPLVGATVTPIGGGQGAATDIDGKFTITVPASVKEIKVTYIGKNPKTVTLSNGMRIYLDDSSNVLETVVVTGYGSGKKLGSVVGSVSVDGEKTFENTPASNFIDALQGQVTGLAINSNSGDPSSTDQTVILRGANSLTLSSTPLYIIDGAPVNSSYFSSLNPADIESVTVLKDASSIAIYGSRGANGIIVVTTKKGKYGANAKTTVRANYGWSAMVKDNVEMMNSQQYMQFRDMIGAPLSGEVQNVINTYGINTNWRNEMFENNAPTYSVDATVTGGSENVSYYVSLNHYDQKGIIENSEMHRETLAWNLDAKLKSWLKVGFVGQVAYRKSKINLEDDADDQLYLTNPMLLARMALPYDSPYGYRINDQGDIVYGKATEKLHYSGITMPHYIYSYNHYSSNRISGNLRLYEQITPIKGLIIKAQQAMEAYDNRGSQTIDPRKTFRTEMGDLVGSGEVGSIISGSNSESFTRYYQFTYTNTAEYKFDIAEKNHFSFLLGQEPIITRNDGFGIGTTGTTDPRMNLLTQGTFTDMSRVSYAKAEYVVNSYMLNGNYDYDDRYFIDFSVRRDGSSRFAKGHRWSTFGAIGLMWNLKNENFLKESTIVDDLRLHYSYGATGNAGVPNFMWQGYVGTTGNYGSGATVSNAGTSLGGVNNPNLSWETVYSHDLGVNVRLFNRVSVAADWYYKRTVDMLYSIPFSITQYPANGYANVCSMSNKGVEVEVTGDIFKNKDWYVGARVGFNYNRNRILELWDGTDEYPVASTGLIQKVGGVMSQFYAVRYVGVDPADGKQMWLDKNDNVTKVFPSDAQVATGKSAYAPWTGGFGANARWKGLSVSANFVFQSGKYMVNNDRYFICNPTGFGTSYNQSVDALNMWTHPGQITDIPAYGETLTYAGDDTSWLEDASFTRLKNLTVAYAFPTNIVSKLGLSALQLHFTGRNLWTITNFSGYDPEIQSNMVQFQYPNTRQYEFGIEVSF